MSSLSSDLTANELLSLPKRELLSILIEGANRNIPDNLLRLSKRETLKFLIAKYMNVPTHVDLETIISALSKNEALALIIIDGVKSSLTDDNDLMKSLRTTIREEIFVNYKVEIGDLEDRPITSITVTQNGGEYQVDMSNIGNEISVVVQENTYEVIV